MNLLFFIALIVYSSFIWTAYCNARASAAPLVPVRFYFHIAYKWWWTPEMRSAVGRLGLVILAWLIWHRLA
ncbi:MAG: hypothetical protein HY081_03710 [Gammaproteobacteria bacterium]|nr:hypothetical protein [Gammaproteobacteria bacterium]